jgi:2-dehydropantoate 2-reductase
MDILIMGAGAIGSVFGGFLAKAGHKVTLLGRQWHMAAVEKTGLRITGIWGEHLVTTLSAKTSPLPLDKFDLVLLTVKSYQSRDAMAEIGRSLSTEAPVLSLQNGLGNLETIAEAVGADRTLGGRVIFGAEILEPGHVKVTVCADKVAIGPMAGSKFPYEQVEAIAALIDQSGIPAFATETIEQYIWGKILYNVALNAPAAILEVNYGRLLEHRSTRKLIEKIVAEAFSVAHAEGVSLDWPSPENYVEVLFQKLIPATAAHFPSMLQDIHNGKKTEIDAMNGAIVRLGRRHGIPTPFNETLTSLIEFQEISKG